MRGNFTQELLDLSSVNHLLNSVRLEDKMKYDPETIEDIKLAVIENHRDNRQGTDCRSRTLAA